VKALDNAKLLGLVADDELADFARHCEIVALRPTRDELSKIIREFEPRFLIDAIIAAKGTTLTMMSDVFQIVARYGASLRTTAYVLVLPGETGPVEHSFSRQMVSMLAAFSDDWTSASRHVAFARLSSAVDATLMPWVQDVRRRGGVQRRSVPNRRNVTGAIPFVRKNHVDGSVMREVDAYVPVLRVAHTRVVAAVDTGPLPAGLDAVTRALAMLEALQGEWRGVGRSDRNPVLNGSFDAQMTYLFMFPVLSRGTA